MVEKRLVTDEDLKQWVDSSTFNVLIDFIVELAQSVKGKENTNYAVPTSPEVERLCSLLDSVVKIIDKYPPKDDGHASRFGKVEFRDFYNELKSNAADEISRLAPRLSREQVDELVVYFVESWGNCRRIDYGSGHELNFICFLYGLTAFSVLSLERDKVNMVLKVFIKYLDVMRVLETRYWLEPAGSHGVWGLDDYHFLPFLFGAFQLAPHKHLKPKSIHNPEVVELFEDKYLYFGCIAFIGRIKTASLRWHSPMLDDISGVKTWNKVSEGMVKMYKAEVLGKLPIMQHFYFSTFLPAPDNVTPASSNVCNSDGGESPHAHSTWGNCCGIPLPSAIAASEMSRQRGKPLPFD